MAEANKKPLKERPAYNTNLASEFYVMSVLCRLGLEANLTLGNKKAVDIVVVPYSRRCRDRRCEGRGRQDRLAGWFIGRDPAAEATFRRTTLQPRAVRSSTYIFPALGFFRTPNICAW